MLPASRAIPLQPGIPYWGKKKVVFFFCSKKLLSIRYRVLIILRVRCLSLGRYSSRGTLAGWREDLRNARVVANKVDMVSRLEVTLICLVSHG